MEKESESSYLYSMRKKLYIETSVWNQLLHTDRPDWRELTDRFLRTCELGIYDLYISVVVLDEIEEAELSLKNKMNEYIDKLSPIVLDYESDSEELMNRYLDEGIIKSHKDNVLADLAQVAIATTNGIKNIVSFNCKHLVKGKNIDAFNIVNLRNNYDTQIIITTPDMFVDLPEEEEDD